MIPNQNIGSLGLILLVFLLPGCAQDSGHPDGDIEPRGDVDGGFVDGADEEPDAGDEVDAGGDPGPDGGDDPAEDGGDIEDGGAADGEPGDGGGDEAPLPDPAEAGPLAVESLQANVPAGQRPDGVDIPLHIHLPDTGAAHPVVVLSHGFLLDPDLYTSYGQHLASWGYAVVLPAYPGSLLAPRVHRLLAQDLSAAIDWLEQSSADPGSLLNGRLDMERLALAGHSMGGKISLLLASQDGRPLAVVGIDPVDAGGGPFGGDPIDYPSVTPELMDQIQVPMLLLGETTNATCQGFGCQACAPEEDNFQQYFEHAASPALEVELLGADHMDFLDDPDCGLTCSMCSPGNVDPASVRLWARSFLTAFLEVELRSNAAYLDYLTGASAQAAEEAGILRIRTKNGY